MEDKKGDEFSCLGAGVQPVKSASHNSSDELMMVECYNGKLHKQGATQHYTPAKSSICKIHEGDVVRCELDLDKGEISYKVNGGDHGVCFKNVRGTIHPAVSFYSTPGRVVELLCVETMVQKTRDDVDEAVVRALCTANPSVLGITDQHGRVPFQIAKDLQVSDEIQTLLLSLSRQSGHMWCGGVDDGLKYGIHFLLHSSGTAQRWAAEGRKWLYFFQATNT